MYHNVTTDEYSGLLSGVNTSAERNFSEHGEQGGVCANYYKVGPRQFYINMSQVIYPGDRNHVNYVDAIKLCVLIIIIVTGLVGNISVILTIALNRSMRTTVNFYIANLAVVDAMTCIFSIPPFYQQLSFHYALGYFVCKIQNFALCTCMVCSVLTLAAISCDRFLAVFFPLHVRVTKQRKPLVVSLVWIISVVVSIPYILVKKMQIIEWKDFQQKKCSADWGRVYYRHQSLGMCETRGPLFHAQTILMTIFMYFLPVTIMIIAYAFILWKLSRTHAPGEQLAFNDNIDSRASKKVHKMVFIVLVVFGICWTPYYTALLFDLTHPKTIDYPKWYLTWAWIVWNIVMGNSMMNPIIYAGMKQEFRQGIFAVLRCRKPIIRAKPPQNMRRAQAVANNHQPKEVNLELEIKGPVVEGP